MKEINIAIIGGGLSGLTIAYLLKNKLTFWNFGNCSSFVFGFFVFFFDEKIRK